jgi:glutamate--cysteine ligase
LQSLDGPTLHMPFGTSLRMGRLGYQSDAQALLAVSYNSLEGYAASLHDALTRPYPAYEAVGIRNPGGDYNQLATTLLQIENEFYGTIRPKRTIFPGERPLHALRERGVEYVEVRLMDLDPFEPLGITASTMRFLDVFLLHCLLSPSPPDSPAEIAALARNQHRTAARGREPGLWLERDGEQIGLQDWGRQLLSAFEPIAQRLDQGVPAPDGLKQAYQQALEHARRRLDEPQDLPSARVLRRVVEAHDRSFVAFARAQSAQTRELFLSQTLDSSDEQRLVQACRDSVRDQQRIESSDSLPFEIYRQQYVSADRLGSPMTARG